MSNLNRHPVRRTAAGVLAGALALSGAVAAATPASAAAGFTLERIAGADRYETSALTAARFDQAVAVTNVIVASGENGRAADALGASFLAGVRGAPVLLTPQAGLAASTRAALTSLRANGATSVTIVGGPAAVSAAVQAEITALGFTVNRLGGVDRFQTAELVVAAGEVAAAGNTGVASNVGIVASGISTVDALAVGPLAYKGRHPIFLTRAAGISASTIASMRANGVTSVFIVGGETVVSANVRTQLTAAGITVVDRLAGQTRSGTSVAIANAIIGGTFGFTNTTFNVASGANDGVDALSGAALSGQQNRALLVTDTATSAGAVTAFATARAATLNEAGIIFGGPAALSVAVETAIEAAGGATTSNQAFVTTLTGTSTVELGGDAASRTRTFSVAVPAGTAVDIQLFQAANVIRNANGTVSFVDADGDNRADPGTPVTNGATLSGVNGVPGGAANGVVSNGTVTFTVTGGTAQDSVVPVIFADTNNDDRLNLVAPATGTTTTPKLPSEPFAVGDTITFVPAAAALGASTPTVSSANVDQDFFIGTTGTGSTAASFTYRYDANDVFQFQGVAVTLAQFESIISAGDALAVSFSPAATGVSTFNILTNVGGAAPGAPTATAANVDAGATVNDVRVSYTRPENNSAGVVYTLQRATVAAGPDGTSGNSDDVTGTFTTVTTATQAAGTATREFVFTDLNLADGLYVYRVVATTPVTGEVQNSNVSNAVRIPGTIEADRPQALDTVLTVNGTGGFAGSLDEGDTFVVRFNEVVTVAAGARLRVRDADTINSSADLVNGGNATFTLNTAAQTVNGVSGATGTVLTVRINTAPTVVAAGTTTGLQLPVTIVDSAGIVDVNGNAFAPSIVGSQDLVIEAVGSDTTSGGGTVVTPPATGPGLSTAVVSSDRTAVVLTFDEAVLAAGGGAFDSTQFTYRPDCQVTTAAVNGTVARTGSSTTSLTFTLVSGSTVNAASDTNDCVIYTRNGTTTAGDVVNSAGEQVADFDSAFVLEV